MDISAANFVVKELDLNSLKSVKKFADEILREETHIDLLVLNAGIMVGLVRFLSGMYMCSNKRLVGVAQA